MEQRIVQFLADERTLSNKYDLEYCRRDMDRFDAFYRQALDGLKTVDFGGLTSDGKLDYVLFKNSVSSRMDDLARRESELAKIQPFIPFAERINQLELDRRAVAPPNQQRIAEQVSALATEVSHTEASIKAESRVDKLDAYRASKALGSLSRSLETWFDFYRGYDPLFSWWVPEPYKRATAALADYRRYLTESVVGFREGDSSAMIGDAVGRDALVSQLQREMVSYTPEELIAIADKEYAWCEKEMKKASHEMGFGDDWKKALDKVRNDYVPPGEEPQLIKGLADEAIEYVTKNDLVTVPPMATEGWTMEMMSPERQLVNPFFTGGRTISVSFPTAEMSQDQKEMSLRANNRHFDRATVFHELIPGHCLQDYYESRYHTYRPQLDYNPFWIEGWAFYWEMLLYDRGFFKTPEDRVGSLFWRMHRCARIVFSLKFHLKEWTAEQCVQYLVDRVGHERFTAEGEVRRSILGDYPPLYQVAYMIGALQFRQLHHDLVDSGKLTNKQFHDRILEAGQMPVELVRAMLGEESLSPDFSTNWKFYGNLTP
jgi:uncharacterized protein (DUF885 family)